MVNFVLFLEFLNKASNTVVFILYAAILVLYILKLINLLFNIKSMNSGIYKFPQAKSTHIGFSLLILLILSYSLYYWEFQKFDLELKTICHLSTLLLIVYLWFLYILKFLNILINPKFLKSEIFDFAKNKSTQIFLCLFIILTFAIMINFRMDSFLNF